jgi:hypothetical protein
VAHIRSLRNRVKALLAQCTITKPNNVMQAELLLLFHHIPYCVSYQPPPWNTKPDPMFMLFNADEERYYYEGIPVSETDEWYEMTDEQQAQAMYLKELGQSERQQDQRTTAMFQVEVVQCSAQVPDKSQDKQQKTMSRFKPRLPHNAILTNSERARRLQDRGKKLFGGHSTENCVYILDKHETSTAPHEDQRIWKLYCQEKSLVEGSTLFKALLQAKRNGELKDPKDEVVYDPLVTMKRKGLGLLQNDKIV